MRWAWTVGSYQPSLKRPNTLYLDRMTAKETHSYGIGCVHNRDSSNERKRILCIGTNDSPRLVFAYSTSWYQHPMSHVYLRWLGWISDNAKKKERQTESQNAQAEKVWKRKVKSKKWKVKSEKWKVKWNRGTIYWVILGLIWETFLLIIIWYLSHIPWDPFYISSLHSPLYPSLFTPRTYDYAARHLETIELVKVYFSAKT